MDIQGIETYVTDLFIRLAPSYLIYHNLAHTQHVVANTIEIADYYQLSSTDKSMLVAAAWFHDTGHIFVDMATHEEKGVEVMKEFLVGENVDKIAQYIMATKFPTHPNGLLEEIICDADTYHFGTDYFRTTDNLIKKEMELRLHKNLTEWYPRTLQLLEHHHFYTAYCVEKLSEGKLLNIEYLKSHLST
jgi:predicted metal-dependent HD superfamily phosphohydrolase